MKLSKLVKGRDLIKTASSDWKHVSSLIDNIYWNLSIDFFILR